MKDMAAGLLLGAIAGSVPFSWLVYRLATGRDLGDVGSGNPGATNVRRAIGPAWGGLALGLDAGKGALGAWLAMGLWGEPAAAAAAFGAVLGHVFSPWLRGRGGKGVAAAAGAFAVLVPSATAFSVAVFVAVVAASGWVSLGSVAGAAILPWAVLLLGPDRAAAGAAALAAATIAWRHRENFERMRAGTEPRWNQRAKGDGRGPS